MILLLLEVQITGKADIGKRQREERIFGFQSVCCAGCQVCSIDLTVIVDLRPSSSAVQLLYEVLEFLYWCSPFGRKVVRDRLFRRRRLSTTGAAGSCGGSLNVGGGDGLRDLRGACSRWLNALGRFGRRSRRKAGSL
jgi:hypothetical protein